MSVLEIIALAAKYATLALQIGGDALPFIEKIKDLAARSADEPVTQADIDNLNAMGEPYLNMLNDTSKDEGE